MSKPYIYNVVTVKDSDSIYIKYRCNTYSFTHFKSTKLDIRQHFNTEKTFHMLYFDSYKCIPFQLYV